MRVLECSSKGDKRFSAFYALVEIFGETRSIEEHYQLAKRANSFVPKTWRDMKGKKPTHIHINHEDLPLEYLTPWYKLLWLCYLDQRPDLVEYASQFNEFTDIFRGKAKNCQADVIKQYIKEGRESVLRDCMPLLKKIGMGVLKHAPEQKEFRLIIAGSRGFNDYQALHDYALRMLRNKIAEEYEIVIVSGTARGADKLGERLAYEKGWRVIHKPADWSLGKSAGYKRNVEMAEIADALLACWDGNPRGTQHMINIAKERNLPVRILRF